MRKALIMCIVMVIAISAPYPFSRHYISTAQERTLEEYSVVELIEHYADLYKQDPALLLRVAECESKYGKTTFGDGGRAFSVYQFHKGTFERWSKERGEPLDYLSYHDHIKLAVWSFAQGEKYRNAWTSYVAIKRGGKYAFYSKLLKKDFVVKCSL